MLASKEVLSHSPEQTHELGRTLGDLLRDGDVVALVGELGSGKTTFTRGLVHGLDCPDYGKVNSPTYVLEQVYQGRFPIHHYDAYRLSGPGELLDLGFDERLVSERVLVIEWADRIIQCLPDERLLVEIVSPGGPGTGDRLFRFSGPAGRWSSALDSLTPTSHPGGETFHRGF